MSIYRFDAWPLCIKMGIHNSAIFFRSSMEISLELNFDPSLNFQFFVSRIFSNTTWEEGGKEERNALGRSYLEIFCELCIEILRLERKKWSGSNENSRISPIPRRQQFSFAVNTPYFDRIHVISWYIGLYQFTRLKNRSKSCSVRKIVTNDRIIINLFNLLLMICFL